MIATDICPNNKAAKKLGVQMVPFDKLLAQSDMVSLTQRLIIERPPASLLLQEIAVAEPLPAVTVGLFARADSPLTRPAAAMVRHIVAVARQFGRA